MKKFLIMGMTLCAASFSYGEQVDKLATKVETINFKPCFVKSVKQELECGTLPIVIKENDLNLEIDLHVTRIPAADQIKKREPIFVFAGGPGQAAGEIAPHALQYLGRAKHFHDIVLVDQRGTGKSYPLDCEFDENIKSNEEMLASFKSCIEPMVKYHGAMSTIHYAHDVEQVRLALGYEKINVWGGSYGTRTAQVYAGQYPESMNKLIIDGVVPNHYSVPLMGERYGMTALKRLDAACQEQAYCLNTFGDTIKLYEEIKAKTDENPVEVDDRKYTGEDIAGVYRSVLYSPNSAVLMPMLLHQGQQGDFGGIDQINRMFTDSAAGGMYIGMTAAVMCQEDFYPEATVGKEAINEVSLMEGTYFEFWEQICDGIANLKKPEYLNTDPIHAETLIISGDLDPITPTESANVAQAYIPNSTHLVNKNGGHINSGVGCFPKLIANFLKDEELKTECIDEIGLPAFALPKEAENDLF